MAENEERRNWAELPSDILSLIYGKLGAINVLWPAQGVCHSWRRVSFEPSLWRRIDLRSHLMPRLQDTDTANIAREAVDRSGGDVEELFIGGLCSYAILSCIVGRTTKLRCLALFSLTIVTMKELVEFIEQCPLLEELQIIECLFFDDDYESIGRACPDLKRFRLNDFVVADNECSSECYIQYECDREAFMIAYNMPNLCELNLVSNKMTNRGLDAILSECLHLEYLDIQHCHNVNLNEGMRAKLAAISTVIRSSSDECMPHDDFEYIDIDIDIDIDSIIEGYYSDYNYGYYSDDIYD